MFTLLHPAALLALTGLLVPVAIHLWNRRPAREVSVGSLRWLAAGANRRLRNLKLEQFWLLLLRAALLAVLAVAVAGPVWRTARPASRGVVLLSPEVLGLPALAAVRATVDSLRQRGYSLRWLAKDFGRVPAAVWRAASKPGRVADSVRASQLGGFAWARMQLAAATFPGQPLVVLTSARLRHLQGSHAPLPAGVRWQVLPDTATTSWLAAAEMVGDSLQLLVGNSNETQTKFRRMRVRNQTDGKPIRVAGLAPMRFQLNPNDGGKPLLVPATVTDSVVGIGVETGPPIVDIYASPEFAADARYLEAAVRAAGVGMPIPPLLRRVRELPKQLNADWTFWLSAEPLPPGWQQYVEKTGSNVWQEATGPGVADTAQLVTSAAPVTVFRREDGRAVSGSQTLWADGLGRPVLSRQALGQGGVYHLHTRLNPAWSQLADASQLPAQLLALLQPEATDEAAAMLFRPRNRALAQRLAHFDQRGLDPAQMAAGQQESRPTATTAPLAQSILLTDLRPGLVLVAGLLFLLERLLARRRETRALISDKL